MKTLKWNASGLSRLAGLSAIAAIAAAGCGKNDDGVAPAGGNEPGNTATGKSVDQNFADTANAVTGTVGNVVGGAENTVGNAGKAVATTGSKAGVAIKNGASAAVNTPTIKSALRASAALKGSNIDVDTSATAVTLKGTVKSSAQKSIAGSIAKKNGGALKIVNNLTVKK